MPDAKSIREQLVFYGRKLEEKGLVVGPGGNISARLGDIMYVKASGTAFEDAQPEDYVGVDLKTGEVVDGSRRPSCEVPMHSRLYRVRPDVGAVVHTHPPLSTALASAGVCLPPMFPDFIALLGREVPVSPYVVPAGEAFADAAEKLMTDHPAAMFANHGVVTVGANLREAYFRNVLVENAALVYLTGRMLGGARCLSDEEVGQIDGLSAEAYRRKLLKGS
jgi:L-fuculose-phosphate aldolase